MNKNNQNNFTYLDQLIHSGDKEIQLEQDITLEKGEEVKFSEGIVIDTDDIIIDANRHSIDARNKTRIFKITEKKRYYKKYQITKWLF